MTSSIRSPQKRLERILFRRVDVLEDGPYSKLAYTKILSDGLGWTINFLNSKHDVVSSIEEGKAQIYILDNRIGNNATEGLEALSELSKRNTDCLIAICSNYPRYKPIAYNIFGRLVAYYEKKTGSDLYSLICDLTFQFIDRIEIEINEIQALLGSLQYEEEQFLSSVLLVARRELRMDRDKLEWLANRVSSAEPSDHVAETLATDPNLEAYERCKKDAVWLQRHNNRYVAFVDGTQVLESVGDENELRSLTRQIYPTKRRLVTKVHMDGDMKIFKQPSSLRRMMRLQ